MKIGDKYKNIKYGHVIEIISLARSAETNNIVEVYFQTFGMTRNTPIKLFLEDYKPYNERLELTNEEIEIIKNHRLQKKLENDTKEFYDKIYTLLGQAKDIFDTGNSEYLEENTKDEYETLKEIFRYM